MGKNILVFVEAREGKVKKPSLEAVSEARRIADRLEARVHAVVVGDQVRPLAAQIGAFGAAKVYTAEDPSFRLYGAEPYAAAVAAAAEKAGSDILFFAATAMGKDLAPTVATMRNAGIIADCTELHWEEGELRATRPVYAGRAYLKVRPRTSPTVYSLRPNMFAAEEFGGAAEVETLDVPTEARSPVRELAAASQGKAELTEASVIVSGGRGLKGPEHFHLRDGLAEVLGGAVGASRAVVDLGWRPHSEQVGQTGKTVSPNLYVAVAISGAIQHQAGMRTSKIIVAINKDPDAPIFKFATYGIVGDAFEIVPALTEELKKVLAK